MEQTPIAPSETFQDLRVDISPPVDETPSAQPRKRGRPPGSKNAPKQTANVVEQPPEIVPPEVLANGVEIIFDIIAKRKGEHWKLDKREKDQIGVYATKVISKWSPLWLAKYGDEISLATVLGMAICTRMLLDARLKLDAQNHEPEAAVDTSDGGMHFASPLKV